jgi:hypothetical protein
MPRRTNPFQQLTASIMAAFHEPDYEVTESIELVCHDTGSIRELDIFIRHKQNPDRNILVECRDYARKQNVQWLDELQGKAQRLGFNFIIAVSSSGFTKPAIREADVRGINALHLKEAEEKDWKQSLFPLNEWGLEVNLPKVKTVIIETPPEIKYQMPPNVDKSKIMLCNRLTKKYMPLPIYLEGTLQDPKNREYWEQNAKIGKVTTFGIEQSNPNLGFWIEPEKKIIPISKLIVDIDFYRIEQQVPLKHYNIKGERVHVGNTRVFGTDTRLVIHERDGQKVLCMIEQKIPIKKQKKRGKKRKANKY